MTVALSSLRVTADFDASSYTRGMQQKIAADQAAAASSDALGRALAAQDAAAGKVIPGVSRLSRSLVEGYTAGSQFETTIRGIGNAADRGLGLDRVGQLLDATYRKFGQVADATTLASQGYVRIAGLVSELNEHYELQNEILSRNVTATRAVAEAQAAQAQINQRLGVRDGSEFAGSAQASAEAFLAEFGGLAGLAKAKAEEAGQAFQQELDTRLVAGVAKSARDSASVFAAELDNLDRIGQLKAQQIGQDFGDDLDARLIAGTAKSARDSATVFQEEFDRLDEIARLRAQQIAQDAQVGLNQSFGIGAQPKSAQASASVFQDAFVAQDAMAKSAENLRGRIDPLGTAQAKLNQELAEYAKLEAAGVISQEEAAKAATVANENFALFRNTVTGVGQAGRLTAGEFVNLSYQINDVVTGLALGQPLFMIAAQQGGQVYQVLANSRAASQGFGAAIAAAGRSVAGAFGAILTPAVGVYAALAAIATVSIASVLSWENAQRGIGKSLLGIGSASGATVDSINKIAEASSSSSKLSVSGAREVAVALAESGKVANDNIGPIVKLTHDFATALGVDTSTAAKQLGASFADPIKGADDLNQRFGFLDDKTKQLIRTLQESGDRQGAVITLTNGLAASVSRAADFTTAWGRAWNYVTNVVSDAYSKLGQTIEGAIVGTLPEQIDALQARAVQLRKRLQDIPATGPDFSGQAARIAVQAVAAEQLAAVEAKIRSLQAQAGAPEVALKQRSLEVGDALRAILPALDQLQTLQGRLNQLSQAMQDPALAAHLADVSKLSLAYERANEAVNSFLDPIAKEAALQRLAIDAITALTTAQRAQIAEQQKNLELSGQAVSAQEKQRAASAAATSVIITDTRQSLSQISPEIEHTIALGNNLANINRALADPSIKTYARSLNDLTLARERAQNAGATFLTQMQKEAQQSALSIEMLNAQTTAERAQIAARQQILSLAGQPFTRGEVQAAGQRAGLQTSIGETLQSISSANQGAEQLMQLKNALDNVGRSVANPAFDVHKYNIQQIAVAYARLSEAVTSFIDPMQKEVLLMQLSVRALDERSPAQRTAIAMEQKRLELSGQAISAEEKAKQVRLAGQIAGGGETAQLNVEQRRISLLGELAQVTDAVRAKEIELRLAHMEGVDVTNAQAEALKRLAALQVDQSRLQQEITIGVGSEVRIRAILAQQLQSYIDKKLLDPTNAKQMADAQVALAKSFEQMSRQAEIARAPLEQLKGLEIDSASLRTQLDQTATTSLNSISSNLAQITSGSVTAADGFRNMGQAVVQAIEEMIIKMTIMAPIARALQDTLGGFLPGGGGGGFSLSGLFGGGGGAGKGVVSSANGNVFSGGNVIPFRRGGVISQPIVFPMANGGIGLAGEAGDEGILPLRRGTDGRLGVSMYGAGAGGGGVTVSAPSISVNVHNHAGSQVTVKDATSDGKGGIGIDVMVDKVSAQNMAKPGSMSNRVMRNTFGNQQRVVRR